MAMSGNERCALVTGGAGFIGFHTARRLLEEGWRVASVDGMTPYYDPELKRRRHELLSEYAKFSAHEFMLEDAQALGALCADFKADVVLHLAAQAGVRYSLENPQAYVSSNLVGTFNLLELLRAHPPKHFLMASTSSVYGANEKMPFAEGDPTDHPLTLYAATKKSTEVMAHAYSHLWRVPTTAFRFFTVYGPWGRPDMALFKFVKAILAGEPIDIYGEGKMVRDFTYIDDLVDCIVRLIEVVPQEGAAKVAGDTLSPAAPFRVVNIGGGQPVELMRFVDVIEQCLGRKGIHNMLPMQPGDVRATAADTSLIEALTGRRPATRVEDGVKAFVTWYRSYYAT